MREIVRVQGQELGRGLTRNGPHLNWRRVLVRADLNSDGCDCTAVVPVKGRAPSDSDVLITTSRPQSYVNDIRCGTG